MAGIDRYRQRQYVGPQIHAVPDNEKAYDASGKKLPWAYETTTSSFTLDADREQQQQRTREPAEKGAFGKSRGSRRGTSRSRSKTGEPAARAEDAARREREGAEERVFGSLKRRDGREVLGEVEGNTVASQSQTQQQAGSAPAMGKLGVEEEATELLLYGFGKDLQWSAIDFFERASGGVVLEDYERTPQSQLRAYDPTHAYSRATLTRNVSKAALRKKNKYAGGDHWIKITFSSREAAELACARSPHVVKGCLVYAEPWQGRRPARDETIFATQAGVQVVSGNLPSSFSTTNMVGEVSPNGSQTISSRTAAGEDETGDERTAAPQRQISGLYGNGSSTTLTPTSQNLQRRPTAPSTVSRIRGAQLATLLPADQALMPKQPRQSLITWLGASELIGTTVPRREDGAFDWERAGVYWRVWALVDGWLATDFCGVRVDE